MANNKLTIEQTRRETRAYAAHLIELGLAYRDGAEIIGIAADGVHVALGGDYTHMQVDALGSYLRANPYPGQW